MSKSPNLKKGFWIPVCLLIFFIGDRIGGWLLAKTVAKSQFRYARLYQNQGAADILLLGNSRGLIFYQPYIEKITQKKTLNLSYNSLPIDLGRVLVEDYLKKYPAPELLLIDVTMCDRINHQLIAGFSTYSSYSESLDKLIKEKSPTSWYAGKLSHLYRYNSEVYQRTLNYLTKSDENWLTDRVISPTMQQHVAQAEVIELTINDYLLQELNALIQAAESKGTRVELLINPYYPPYIKRMRSFYDFIGKLEAFTEKKIKDYSHALAATEGFGDYQHLNKKGSQQYIDLLLKDGVFK